MGIEVKVGGEVDAGRKSVAELIDSLSVTNIKCWFAQEKVMSAQTDSEVAEAARLAQTTNARRNQLMRAIDAYFGDQNAQLPKTYDTDEQSATEVHPRHLELVEDYLTGICDIVLHRDDKRNLNDYAQAAWDYLKKQAAVE